MQQHDEGTTRQDDIVQRVEAMERDIDDALEETREVQRVEHAPVAQQDDGAYRLIQMALERGADVEKLAGLIELRNREIARQAKVEYESKFAEMQRTFERVVRTKEAKDSDGRVLYAFAPLEHIVAVVGPTIAEFGFRYRFEEQRVEGADEKRVTCIVSGYGHEERTSVDIPIPPATKFSNSIQQRGSASSYGRRYAFIAAFGLTINDEDDDAQLYTIAEIEEMMPGIAAIQTAESIEHLKVVYKEAFKACVTEAHKLLVIAAKNKRKGELNGPAN